MRHEDCFDLAGWVAQLDAAHRRAYAARIQDRLRILEQLLEIAMNAKRKQSLTTATPCQLDLDTLAAAEVEI